MQKFNVTLPILLTILNTLNNQAYAAPLTNQLQVKTPVCSSQFPYQKILQQMLERDEPLTMQQANTVRNLYWQFECGFKPYQAKDIVLINNVAFYLAELGNTPDAIQLLDQVIKLDNQRAIAYLNRADAHYEQCQLPEAIEDFKTYIRLRKSQESKPNIPIRIYNDLQNASTLFKEGTIARQIKKTFVDKQQTTTKFVKDLIISPTKNDYYQRLRSYRGRVTIYVFLSSQPDKVIFQKQLYATGKTLNFGRIYTKKPENLITQVLFDDCPIIMKTKGRTDER